MNENKNRLDAGQEETYAPNYLKSIAPLLIGLLTNVGACACIGNALESLILMLGIFLGTCGNVLDEVDATLVLGLNLRPCSLNFLFLSYKAIVTAVGPHGERCDYSYEGASHFTHTEASLSCTSSREIVNWIHVVNVWIVCCVLIHSFMY